LTIPVNGPKNLAHGSTSSDPKGFLTTYQPAHSIGQFQGRLNMAARDDFGLKIMECLRLWIWHQFLSQSVKMIG